MNLVSSGMVCSRLQLLDCTKLFYLTVLTHCTKYLSSLLCLFVKETGFTLGLQPQMIPIIDVSQVLLLIQHQDNYLWSNFSFRLCTTPTRQADSALTTNGFALSARPPSVSIYQCIASDHPMLHSIHSCCNSTLLYTHRMKGRPSPPLRRRTTRYDLSKCL